MDELILDDKYIDIEQSIIPLKPASVEPPPLLEVDRFGEPVSWHVCSLVGPDGNEIPYLRQVDQKLLISTKVRTCRGCDSWCAAQCRMSDNRKDAFRNSPCPVELQRAWETLVGFCRELQLSIQADDALVAPDLNSIMEQLTNIDLINEYIFWDLVALRTHMAQACSGIVEEVPIAMKGPEVLYQPQLNPLIEAAEKATMIKLKIAKEFMTTRRGKLEAALKSIETKNSMAEYFVKIRQRAEEQGYVVQEMQED